MKALIRNTGETVTERDGLTFINWQNGAPLTSSDWYGGPYTLVNDYVPTADEDFAEEPEIVTEPAESEETVTIGGKEYTLDELKKLIGD